MNKRKEIAPNNLKECRVKVGLTQKQVASMLGFFNEVSICHWEQGKNILNLINLFKLCGIYQTSPITLYTELSETFRKRKY